MDMCMCIDMDIHRVHVHILPVQAYMLFASQSTRQAGAVPVSLQSNSTMFKATATLVLLKRPHIEAVAPVRGPQRGGTKVIFRGSDFPNTMTDRCFFGSVLTVPRLR